MLDIQKLSDLSCLVLFILTHGEENGILYGYDKNFTINKHIIEELLPKNCPGLAAKPKLLFLQACQGENTDHGTNVRAVIPSQLSRYIIYNVYCWFS